MTSVLRRSTAVFLISTSFVIAACMLIVRSRAFAANPEIAAWGVTFDLTITIPLLYWMFVVRPRHAHPLTLAPLFVVCTFLAAAIVPRTQHDFLRDLRWLAVPLEIAMAVAVVQRLRRFRAEGPRNRVEAIVASELQMLYYAFGCWTKKPAPLPGRAITFHERSGWPTILAGIFLLIAFEGIGMHLLLARWSSVAAWTWTALDLWAVIWFLGDYHALRLRRSWLDAHALHIRLGIRWSVDVELANIARVEAIAEEKQWKNRETLKLAMLDEPKVLITLREPVIAHGLAGFQKRISALALLPDDDASLLPLHDH